MSKTSKYITTAELMELFQVSRDSVVRWRKKGMPYNKIGRLVRFDKDEVTEWIESRNETPGQDELRNAIEIISYRSSLIRRLTETPGSGGNIIESYDNYYEKWLSGEFTKEDYDEIVKREELWSDIDKNLMNNIDEQDRKRSKEKINQQILKIKDGIAKKQFFSKIEGEKQLDADNTIFLDIKEKEFNKLTRDKPIEIKELLEKAKENNIKIMYLAEYNEQGYQQESENSYITGESGSSCGTIEDARKLYKRNELWKKEKAKTEI